MAGNGQRSSLVKTLTEQPPPPATLLAENTELRARAFQVLHELARAAGALLDPAAVAQLAADDARDLLAVDAASVFWWDADAGRLRWLAHNIPHLSLAGPVLRPGEGAAGLAFQRRAPVVVEDYQHWEHAIAWQPARETTTVAAVPLIARGRAIGVLVVRTRGPRDYASEDIQFLSLLAAQVAPVLETAQLYAESERRRTEAEAHAERYRTLFEAVACGVVVLGANGDILHANHAAEQSFGLTLDQMYGKPPEALLPGRREDGSDLPPEERPGRLALRQRRPVRDYLIGVIRPDGKRRWLQGNSIPVFGPDGEPRYVVCSFLDVTAHKQAEEGLQQSRMRLQLLNNIATGMTAGMSVEQIVARTLHEISEAFPTLRVAYSVIDPHGRLTVLRSLEPPGMQALTGLSVDLTTGPEYLSALSAGAAVIANDVTQDPRLAPLDAVMMANSARAVLDVPLQHSAQLVGLLCLDSPEPRSWSEHEVATLTEAAQYLSMILKDAHEQQEREEAESLLRHREEQLRHAKKMEAMGRLAGGVAHDFNNLLTVISGYNELLQNALPTTSPIRAYVDEIAKAGEHATSLTGQLLAFSRRQVLTPSILDLNTVVARTEDMLRRLIGEDIELITKCAHNLPFVEADEGQIQQVILNLAVNARDAMPAGGRLLIETANVTLNEPLVHAHGSVPPAAYVMLAVSDSGCGMDVDTQSRIFEPFFTTKEPGKGTGLGLATVYGVVQQTGGHIMVESEPGRGARFAIYLPRVLARPVPRRSADASGHLPQSSGTILVVEDEARVRSLVCHVLKGSGYTVLEASQGEEALQISAQHEGRIDLLLTDVVMPGMSGPAVAQRLLRQLPGMQVLYMSGYPDDEILQHGMEAGQAFLQKPFKAEAIRQKVSHLLDEAEDRQVQPSPDSYLGS
jgi:PAS domain S-box-containing protein